MNKSEEIGKNWVYLKAGFINKLRHRKQYLIFDFKRNDGYLLDRYLIQQQVVVKYPKKGEFANPNYQNVVVYIISFAEKDEDKVRKALDELYKQCLLFDDGKQYLEAIDFIMPMIVENDDRKK